MLNEEYQLEPLGKILDDMSVQIAALYILYKYNNIDKEYFELQKGKILSAAIKKIRKQQNFMSEN